MSYSLKQKSISISKSLEDLKVELREEKNRTIQIIEELTEEFKAAAAKGDRSENAEFTEAVDKLSTNNTALSLIDTKLKAIENKVDEPADYRTIGLVVMYSTVKLSTMDGREFIFKVYPKGVSDINRGILAVDSPLGEVIWLKEVGDDVTIEHRVTGELIKYHIDDIY